MKKKIDKVFQDRFHNLKITPPMESWEVINAALPKRRKRRLYPLWHEMAGIAAMLTLLFSLYNSFVATRIDESIPIVTASPKDKLIYTIPFSKDNRLIKCDSTSTFVNLKFDGFKGSIKQDETIISDIQTSGIDATDSSTVSDEIKPILKTTSSLESENSKLTGIENKVDVQVESPISGVTSEITETQNGIDRVESLNKEKVTDSPLEGNSGLKRFSIRTTAGAVYFDNLGKGNSLDSRYADHTTSNEFTIVYGLNVAYRISPKLNIRTGVNKIQLSQNTKNVEFEVALLSESLNPNEITTPFLATPGGSNGYLNQTLEFIEIPFELEAALVDKTFGVNIIGGFSAFFLDANMVTHKTSMVETALGEANNINSLSYSANFGLGFNYSFSPLFQFNFEPIFKYQINTYTKGEGLSPYIFGVYSGLTLKF